MFKKRKQLMDAVESIQYNKVLHDKKSITTSVGYFELPQEPLVISKPHTDVELNVIILKSHTEPTYVEVWCKDKDETDLVFSKLLSIYGCTQLN